MIKKLKAGYIYMKDWPLEDYLNPVFAENRVKKSMNFANKAIPPLLFLTIIWSLFIGGYFKGVPFIYALSLNLEATIACLFVLCIIPIQGLYWFYRRSVTPLNEKQQVFYRTLCKKLDHTFTLMPTMRDLEVEINYGLKKLSKDFLKEL